MPTKEQSGIRRAGSTWPRTNARNLVGRRFGRLKVIEETDDRAANGAIVWLCECRCGKPARVASHNLRSGNTTSCGCVQVEESRRANRKGGVRWRSG